MMAKETKALLDRAAKYIGKGLEMSAYVSTTGGNLFAERLLKRIRQYSAEATPESAAYLLDMAMKYVGKGLEMEAYTNTVGGNLFAERLLGQLREFRASGAFAHHATKKSPAQLDREIANTLTWRKGDQALFWAGMRQWVPVEIYDVTAAGNPRIIHPVTGKLTVVRAKASLERPSPARRAARQSPNHHATMKWQPIDAGFDAGVKAGEEYARADSAPRGALVLMRATARSDFERGLVRGYENVLGQHSSRRS